MRTLRVLPLVALIVLAAAQAAAAQSEGPLQPLEISSPQATYQSFLQQVAAVEEAALAYRDARTSENQEVAVREVRKAGRLFDLSGIPVAARDDAAEESMAALADILLRIPLPDIESIPDAAAVEAEELKRWTLPGSEITVVRLKKGDRADGWVFSAETVARLQAWRDQVEDWPVLVEDAAITDWRGSDISVTGPLIPIALVEALPDVFDTPVLGTPLWKVVVGLLAAMLISLLVAAWWRWIGSRGAKGSVTDYVLSLTTPLVLILLITAYRSFMDTQVNHSGTFAQLVLYGTTIVFYLAAAWAFWVLARLVVEWVIATPVIAENTYDAHLLRLLSRVVSIVGAAGILLYGANDIGIPALGLLAGLGVGGLVIGLAAQGTVENVLAGITLLADKPFRVGDMVAVGEERGTVEAIGPRSTRIRKLDGTRLTLPNAELVSSQVTNFAQRTNVLFLHRIGVRYETSRAQLQRLIAGIVSVMREHPLVISDDEMPRVRLVGFGASSIDVEVRAYVDTTSYHEFTGVQQELLLAITGVIEDVGTAIAFPSTTAYLTRDTGIGDLPEAGSSGETASAPTAATADP